MLNFLRQAYFSYKGLFMWLNWPGYTSSMVFRPAFQIAIFALVGKFALNPETSQTYIIGMAAYQIPFVMLGGIVQCFTYERSFGTLSIIYASAGSRWANYFAKAVLHYPNGLIVIIMSLLASWSFLGLTFSNVGWLSLIVSILVIAASSATCALFIGNFAIITNDWSTVYGVFAGVQIALTGVIIPTASLPWFLPQFSQIIPLTHGLAAFRQAFEGAGIAAIGFDLLMELLTGIVYGALGFAMFRFMEREAKRRGVLDSSGA
jgi:ABC-2 type transport system permease protein